MTRECVFGFVLSPPPAPPEDRGRLHAKSAGRISSTATQATSKGATATPADCALAIVSAMGSVVCVDQIRSCMERRVMFVSSMVHTVQGDTIQIASSSIGQPTVVICDLNRHVHPLFSRCAKIAAERNKPGRNVIALDESTLTVYKNTAVNNYTET